MSEAAELAFVKNQLNLLSSLPVMFPDDYQQAPGDTLKRVAPLALDIPPPPPPKTVSDVSPNAISLTFKSTKPPKVFPLSGVNPTDSIASIKALLALQPGAPPADIQRLLLRGKALQDEKLLREYGAKDGDVINIMLRPGADWDWSKITSTTAVAKDHDSSMSSLDPAAGLPKERRKHSRIPSVVLSPSPSTSDLGEEPPSIPLTLDTSMIPTASEHASSGSAYHQVISSPDFWLNLNAFLRAQFDNQQDSAAAFEAFLIGAKGSLTASEIAKIRDTVGIIGMAGI